MSAGDKRAARRIEIEVRVDLESDHVFFTGLTHNVSAGGLFVATHDIRPVGHRLAVRCALPGGDRTLDLETEVRWIRETTALQRRDGPTGMGLAFVGLPPEAEAAISRFVREADSLYVDDE